MHKFCICYNLYTFLCYLLGRFAPSTFSRYFGVNDFYPFVRAELKECDPKTVTLIEKMWGVK